jgi:hypothetical protein
VAFTLRSPQLRVLKKHIDQTHQDQLQAHRLERTRGGKNRGARTAHRFSQFSQRILESEKLRNGQPFVGYNA